MKKLLYILFIFSVFFATVFSQEMIHRRVIPEELTSEGLQEIHKPIVDDLQGLNDIESLLLKSKSSDWQTAIRNPQREFYEEEGFNAKDTRTTINKTLLGNGFLLIEEIEQTWDGSAWDNSGKNSYTYDGNKNLVETLYQYWVGSAWEISAKSSYTYDGNSNLTELLNQGWDGSAWVNNFKSSYTYDGNSNLTELLNQEWDGSAWVNYSNRSHTYDGNNNLTEYQYQFWSGSAWLNIYKSSYTYDANNSLTEELYQTWDGSLWVIEDKYSYTYDGNNNLIEDFHQVWDGSTWVNDGKSSYIYDGNNNLTERLGQSWDGSAWVNSSKQTYTYDGNNNQTEYLRQYWDGSAWVNNEKYSYTYVPITAVNEDISSVNSYSLSNNYPNPFNPSTKIQYSVPQSSNVLIKVFDILGNEIETLVNQEKPAGIYELTWDAVNLPGGVYFYQLKADSFVESKKMVLIK